MNKKEAAIDRAQWRKIVDDCINRDPEISKFQWCEGHGINYRKFLYWQRKFLSESPDQRNSLRNARSGNKVQTSIPAFVDVTAHLETVREKHLTVDDEHGAASLTPELMIQAGSYRIYVNSSIHEATLEKVIRVIRHA